VAQKPLTETMLWEGLPENANRPFQLRLPAPVYAKLQWAAERAGKSMHRIALEAVRQAVEREFESILGHGDAGERV
jgi:predicted transcriptional regulator